MITFDARRAKGLKAGDHLTFDEAPGLRLVASETRRSWIYRYKSPVDGSMRQQKLGQWPALSAAAAVVAWEDLRSRRDAGEDPAADRKVARAAQRVQAQQAAQARAEGPFTVGRLLDAFVDVAAAKRAPKGAAELRRTLDTGAASLRALMPAVVTRSVAYEAISALSATPVQAKNLRRELGAAWDWAHDSGKLADDVPNWWRQVLRGKLKSRGKIIGGEHQGVHKRTLSPAEIGQVIRLLPHCSGLIRDLLTLYLWTGCRGAELVQLAGADVTKEANGWWWTLPKARLKMKHNELTVDLRVPLVGRALELVQARREVHGDGYLFPGLKGGHVDQKVVGVAVWYHRADTDSRAEQTRMRWPMPHWAPHDLRRTVRTQLAALGCPTDVGEAILGHIPPGVEAIYNRHTYDRERRRWLTKLADHLERLAKRDARG